MSTIEEIQFLKRLHQMRRENFDYASSNSVVKARLFVDSLSGLLTYPDRIRNGVGEDMSYNTETLLQLKRDAQSWISKRNIASGQYSFMEYCPE